MTFKVDEIYHCGAVVNGVFPYDVLKAHNVNGTVEIISLASLRKLKKVHHISTIGVCFMKSLETDPLKSGLIDRASGYT
jgi:thioester reductase-like protein